ncbi:hypothetical protein ABIE62_002929 [Porphyrobacter sp. MBR-155]|jgi:hypothetical protein|uniref:hypothetical protein n=1 Tax=Porphyrobacter sp. MBR-155 TaxID=3156464 RepID=UPI003393E119
MKRRLRPGLAAIIMLSCLLGNRALEADPVLHVLVQLPMLGLCGVLLSPRCEWRWAQGGFAPLLAALFGIAFWMLPRSIDGAVSFPLMTLAKFLSVPLIGALLAIGWRQAHALLRGFLKAQAVSMAGFMAFLFTHSPVRLCNNYLIDDQWRLGFGFLFLAIGLAMAWTIPLLFNARPRALPLTRTKSMTPVQSGTST